MTSFLSRHVSKYVHLCRTYGQLVVFYGSNMNIEQGDDGTYVNALWIV